MPGQEERGRKGRPSFTSQKTSDRLRECERRPSSPTSVKIKPQQQRKSVFREEGLDDLNTSVHIHQEGEKSFLHDLRIENAKRLDTHSEEVLSTSAEKDRTPRPGGLFSRLGRGSRTTMPATSNAPPSSFSSLPRAALLIMLIAVVVPAFRYSGEDIITVSGADADLIRTAELVEHGSAIEGRQTSPTAVCTRWAHQAANVNGTIYIYGGQATQESGQTTDTWNNDFLTLDLTKTWDRTLPSLKGLPQPSGPPAVALGALWHTYDSLFLYGGEFSDNPVTSPLPVSTWEYNIKSATWTEFSNPETSAGNNSDGGNQPVQRSAEGAGLSVPELGRSWYFGGHLDLYTTEGWSDQIARVYLKSLLEFTHPGYANSGVTSLGTTKAAGSGGVYRNITQGGLQDEAGFTERADGVLVYIPGWGEEGIVLGLAGGTNESFTEMSTIDVYDVANSIWYKQATSGTTPPIRVNPCAVVAAAPDGTSFNIYLYGGQNLVPYDEQVQYSDMWILTIPSFTWIPVNMDGQSQPPARAGHTCTMWDGQIVVVGGYVGTNISCDSPGIYVFDASSLEWVNSFTALSSSSSSDGGNDQGSSVLEGSVGYQVPAPVQSVIGGGSAGGATATTPAAGSATAGPLATGRNPVFTITQSGSTIIQTAFPTSSSSPASTSPAANKSTNTGAVVAGVIAGLLAVLAAYLAFCTWLYRKQLGMYKNHVQMAQRTAFGGTVTPDNGGMWGEGSVNGRAGEKTAGGGSILLGPFGTEISRSANSASGGEGSAGRTSMGKNSGEVGRTSMGGSEGSGHRIATGHGVAGPSRYSRVSEGEERTEYLGGGEMAGGVGRSGRNLGHSRNASAGTASLGGQSDGSQEDLLGNQEPSFFSVVLNPRRTLRVVNLD